MTRALELFAGIGGFAAACPPGVEIVQALDISGHVIEVNALNFGHPTRQANLEVVRADELAALEADLWWMSPPCQPYTVRGLQKDLEDHRARSLLHLLDVIAEVRPRFFAMENVAGFLASQARERLLSMLEGAGYEVEELELCPTALGVPAKRERYYLVASRDAFQERTAREVTRRTIASLLDDAPDPELFLKPEIVERHGPGMRIVRRGDEGATLNCFTSAYGKTWRFSGSFLEEPDGRVRLFSPREIERVMGFPEGWRWPEGFTRRQRYKYLGNSLSVPAVRYVLEALPL